MKKNFKRSFICICAAVGFLSSLFVPCYSSGGLFYAPELVGRTENDYVISAYNFSDLDANSWYFQYVDLLMKEGVVKGVTETEYKPDGTFTVAECSAVIVRFLGLEDYASRRRAEMMSNGVVGSDLWYSGYIQTLYDTKILEPARFSLSAGQKFVTINDAGILERPIKRYEFSDLITRSFDHGTSVVKSRAMYPEISDNGNHFITGGRYDPSYTMYQYEIADFESVPSNSRDNLLKAYYNGIFNGDAVGNFNPLENLRRSEMAKVISVIIKPEMRTRNEYRTLVQSYNIPEEKFVYDAWGEKTLDRAYAGSLLYEAAGSLTCGGGGVSYTPVNAPEGYFIEVRFYEKTGSVYTEKLKTRLSDSAPLFCSGNSIRVIFTLRNSSNAKVEGVLRADISGGGAPVFANLFKSAAV